VARNLRWRESSERPESLGAESHIDDAQPEVPAPPLRLAGTSPCPLMPIPPLQAS
jgi:hypothetical protein